MSQKRAAILLNPDPVPENEQNVIVFGNTKLDRIALSKKKKDEATGTVNNRAPKIIRNMSDLLEKTVSPIESPPLLPEDRDDDRQEESDILHRLLNTVT